MTLSPDTRTSLILRLQRSDDSRVWSEFVSIYQAVIYRMARQQGLSRDDAADVTQDVLSRLTKAINGWDENPELGSFRGWLYRMTRNMAIDFLRKMRRQPLTGNPPAFQAALNQVAECGSDEFDLEFERQLFRRAANLIEGEFTTTTWQAFWRTTVAGESIAAVAESLEISRGAVYIARSRAIARLKLAVQELLHQTTGE